MTDEEIRNLSPEDMEKIQRKQQLMKEAEQCLFDIRDRYVFRMGEPWREVYSRWVLYYDCTLKYIHLHDRVTGIQYSGYPPFCVKLTTENIYKLLLDYYEPKDEMSRFYASEFRSFLEHTRKLPVYKIPDKRA